MNKALIILCLVTLTGLSKSIQKKVDKQIIKTFNITEFKFSEVDLDLTVTKTLPATFGQDNLFKIETEESLIGYAYISRAFGKVDYFDYLVLLDKELIIVNTKILVYREDYGGEIGSKRWLKQFIGKSKNDELFYGENISGISGATVSVQVMTNAMNDLLKSIKILHEKNVL
ncbi:MAG: FMN-binding protein [Flavobacteriaceae bacterium]|nr:FMN-binding protein [Flavobacteriaceae bacterium]